MASDPEYRVHGIWSKLLKTFVREHRPVSIVSFSDNRLFSGGVYEKIGFSYDGEVPPDYYWVKGQRRFHKSGLRKKGEEKQSGLTEAQLREAQGYRKIWDLGKKRWVFIQTVDG
jgi:predicted acetyltransferase